MSLATSEPHEGDAVPRCAIVIPTYNGAALTGACLQALLANPPRRCAWTVIVVDDGSTDGTPASLARFGTQIQLLEQPQNTGFAQACNAGARAARDTDYLVFLNNDTLPTGGWLDALVEEALSDERVAAVGAKLLFPNGLVQHAGVMIGDDRVPHHLYAGFDERHPAVNRAKDVVAVTAACLLVRRNDFEALAGFDAAFHNGYEDIDLCLRLRERGRVTRYCPRSVVYHLESVTRWPTGAPVGMETSERLWNERWRDRVVPDDIHHYIEDGLLRLSYGPHFPLTLTVSPELAVISRDGEEPAGLERLLARRSRQVMEMLSDRVRDDLRALTAATPDTGTRVVREPMLARQIAEGREYQLGDPAARHFVSVLLPVKNGAPSLRRLLPLVLDQAVSARLEFVAVDSGSEDDSVEVLKRHGATVLAIEPSQFDHGLTRNLAAQHARGDILVFVNQTALPSGDLWLAPLVAALDADPAVAGVCSRVIPHEDADLLTRRDVERELSASSERRRMQIEDWGVYRRMSPEARRVFLNFHTVSAAISAEAWQRTPFRSVRTLGEDLLWAREVAESGWALVHEPASAVYHSHSYTLGELFARNVDDGIANREIVGRSMERTEIVPMIRAMSQSDWQYLRETLKLSSEELERWQIESVLRRAAQVAGQWVGTNFQTLPEGTAAGFSSFARVRAGLRDAGEAAP